MFAQAQSEHHWLKQLVGTWKIQHQCQMPDGTSSTADGTMVCRSLGELWLISESCGSDADGNAWSSIMTLGFDPTKKCYVGTFIGSMMANLWTYQGLVDAGHKRLALDTLGPKFDGSGTCNYRDTIEIIDQECWLFTSEMQNDAGQWNQFMSGRHTRV